MPVGVTGFYRPDWGVKQTVMSILSRKKLNYVTHAVVNIQRVTINANSVSAMKAMVLSNGKTVWREQAKSNEPEITGAFSLYSPTL